MCLVGYSNWLLAGCNDRELCLVAIDGDIYDLTHFVTEHPGTPETLLEFAGQDCSRVFREINHSRLAHRLRMRFNLTRDIRYAGNCDNVSPTITASMQDSDVEDTEGDGGDAEDHSGQYSCSTAGMVGHNRSISRLGALMHAESTRITDKIRSDADFAACRDLERPCVSVVETDRNYESLICRNESCYTFSKCHEGQIRLYFDPLIQEWIAWCVSCGMERTLDTVANSISERDAIASASTGQLLSPQ